MAYNESYRFQLFLKYFEFGEDDECWGWKGSIDHRGGYGRFIWKEKGIVTAHVASYEFFIGKRHGKFVLHSCDTPACVNPKHLWLGTQVDNIKDMDNKGRRCNHYGPNPALGNPGETNSQAVITWKIVRKIRKKYATGKYTYKELGLRYNCSSGTVADVVKKRHWIEKED